MSNCRMIQKRHNTERCDCKERAQRLEAAWVEVDLCHTSILEYTAPRQHICEV